MQFCPSIAAHKERVSAKNVALAKNKEENKDVFGKLKKVVERADDTGAVQVDEVQALLSAVQAKPVGAVKVAEPVSGVSTMEITVAASS